MLSGHLLKIGSGRCVLCVLVLFGTIGPPSLQSSCATLHDFAALPSAQHANAPDISTSLELRDSFCPVFLEMLSVRFQHSQDLITENGQLRKDAHVMIAAWTR